MKGDTDVSIQNYEIGDLLKHKLSDELLEYVQDKNIK